MTNDADYPPGKGEKVVVGFWEHPEDYEPGEDENPCAGEPIFKIAYSSALRATRLGDPSKTRCDKDSGTIFSGS